MPNIVPTINADCADMSPVVLNTKIPLDKVNYGFLLFFSIVLTVASAL